MCNEHAQFRDEVLRYCTQIGKDRLLVQAAGGNVSWKCENTLWIKASGTWLAHAQMKQIFVPVDMVPIYYALERGDYSVNPVVLEGFSLRPSIETLLHTLMPHRFVLHLHPVNVVAYLARKNCRIELEAALNGTFKWDLVDYHKPGSSLAHAVHNSLKENPQIQALLLKKHGLILGGDSIEEIDILLQSICQRLTIEPRAFSGSAPPNPSLVNKTVASSNFQYCSNEYIQNLVFDNELYQRLSDSWAICPDHVVFLGAEALILKDSSSLRKQIKAIDPSVAFIFIDGIGVLENRLVTPAQKAQLIFFLDVMVRQSVGVCLEPLSNNQILDLLNWDAEKYRQALSK